MNCDTHFKVIVAGLNVEKWVDCCLQTLVKQKYKNWEGVFIDDCSTDSTMEITKKYESQIKITSNEKHSPKIITLQNAIRTLQPKNEDVLVFLDADDCLSDDGVLDYLNSIYSSDDIWVTWGSFIETKNLTVFGDHSNVPISKGPRPCPKGKNIRIGWRFSHLKTMKYFLWKNIKESSFISNITGKYLEGADDCCFMFPAIEMARPNHIKYISRLMYIYNNSNPNSYMRVMKEKQKQAFYEVTKLRKKYPQKTKKELL